jgi:hypothetical protein
MISQRSHQSAYYRCRYPDEYALANKVPHPRNIVVRESDVIPALDVWLALQFAPGTAQPRSTGSGKPSRRSPRPSATSTTRCR